MKRITVALFITLFMASAAAAEPEAVAQERETPVSGKKKIFMQVGAIEKVENDKFVMRKLETRFEFYADENTKIFLRTEASFDDVQEKYYLVIKGPKNKKVVLANSIYIYTSKEEYDAFMGKKEENPEEAQKIFSFALEGTVKQKDPFIITLADGTEYTVSFDEDTYWILSKRSEPGEMKPGERIKLFFDKLYSIRYKNYPVKIVIDRVKAGF